MRQLFLDTETTGLEPEHGHRIIEIGCVEMIDRRLTGRYYHQYINPDREIDDGAIAVHGLTNQFLSDKPFFSAVADEFLAFIKNADLIIHNAPFDVGFINHEFRLLRRGDLLPVTEYCSIIDTLKMAREKHPGQKNNLDALCRRYEVNNAHRELHGALLDAEILSDVYLRMTGGQVGLALSGSSAEGESVAGRHDTSTIRRLSREGIFLPVITAAETEMDKHQAQLEKINKKSANPCIWLATDIRDAR